MTPKPSAMPDESAEHGERDPLGEHDQRGLARREAHGAQHAELAPPVQHRHQQCLEHGQRDDRQEDAVEQVVAEVVDADGGVEFRRCLAPVKRPARRAGSGAQRVDHAARRPRRRASRIATEVAAPGAASQWRAVSSGMSTTPSSTSRMPVCEDARSRGRAAPARRPGGLRGEHEARSDAEAQPIGESPARPRRPSGPAAVRNRPAVELRRAGRRTALRWPDRRRTRAPAAADAAELASALTVSRGAATVTRTARAPASATRAP